MKTKQQWPVSTIVMLTVFYASIIFVIIEGWKSAGPLRSVLISMVMLIYIFQKWVNNYGGWESIPGLKKNKNVLFLDGVFGCAEGKIEEEYGGMCSLQVAVRKEDAPKGEWERLSGSKGFFAVLAGRVHLNIVRPSWQFHELSGQELGVDEGAIIVLSGIDENRPISTIDNMLSNRVDYLEQKLMEINTIVQTTVSESNRQAQTGTQNFTDAIHSILPILRELSTSKQPSQQSFQIRPGGE